jgi:DNA polymerase-3 subunit beta
MRIAVDRSVFTDAVKWVEQGLAKNPAQPVLGYVPLSVSGGRLTLSGFDYEVGAETSVDVTVDGGGTFKTLVSGRLLGQLAGALPRDTVYLTLNEGEEVGLSCGASEWTLHTAPVEEYPALPPLPPLLGTVNGGDFADAVSRVAFATGAADGLPVLAGVWVVLDGDHITMFASDRFRIPHITIPWEPSRPDIDARVSLPARFIQTAAKQMAGEAKLSLAFDGASSHVGTFGLDAGWRHITGRPYASEYPTNILKAADAVKPSTFVDVDTAALTEAVKRVSMILDPKMPLGMEVGNRQITVSAAGDTTASGREAVTAEIDGEPFDTLINPHFLTDALSAMRTPTTRLGYSAARRQFLITAPDVSPSDTTPYRHVVMAIRPV